MTQEKTKQAEPVAIIGIGCRFPGAKGPEAFWQLLMDGVDAITEVPASRFDINAFYHPTPRTAGKICSRFGGFIADVENFDAEFFGISPREAETIDPQHRLLMEIAYEALEDAGLPPDRAAMPDAGVGVFLGMMSDDYLRYTYRSPDLDVTLAAGGSRGTAAARISYTLGFQGPSLVVDADRASSLTALHLACQSLRARECSVALAGACNLILSPELSIACSRSGVLSADGRCKFCDARADGIGRSEGCGVLVLKRLSDVRRESDRVYAIIRGSAVANNGNSSMELMRPSAQAQESLLRTALRDAGVCASDVLYVEAHGTGTPVGDRVETEALGAVFGGDRPVGRPCLIGSAKTNIGHAEAAAGMAGVIKVALSLRHGLIPKTLHFEHENPELVLEERRLRVQTDATPWPVSDGKPALAGVSAFGLTGALAHVVLEAAPDQPEGSVPASDSTPYLLPLSARSVKSLDSLVLAYRDWMERPLAAQLLPRACYSASVHRQHHPHRVSFVASSPRMMREQFDTYLKDSRPYPGAQGHVISGKAAKLAFIFPGQGGQWVEMGRELLAREPVFRNAVELCDEAIRAEAGWSVLGFLQGEMPDALFEELDYLQPALTTVMISLAKLWQSWGVKPNAVIGFSMGEVAAAQVAGILDIPEAMAVVCCRTRLMKRLNGQGTLASVPLSWAEAEEALTAYRSQLSVAAVASPANTVLSGDPTAMKALVDDLESRGHVCRFIKAPVASHSVQMEVLLDELKAQLAGLKPGVGSIPLASTVDDKYLTGPEMDAGYWARNLRHPILQMNGIERLLRDGYTCFLEVSPHPIAWNPLWETIRHNRAEATAVSSLRRNEGEREALLKAAGALYAQGLEADWPALVQAEDRCFVSLPTYRWEQKPCWLKVTQSERPLTARISVAMAPATPKASAHSRLLEELKTLSSGQRRKRLLDHVQGVTGRILKLGEGNVADCRAPLRQLGLTSLMATELALELEQTLRCPCSATIVFNYPTIEKLTDHLLSRIADSLSAPESVSSQERASHSSSSVPEIVPLTNSSAGTSVCSQQPGDAELAEPIAIIGLACRFPGGAATPEDYWRVLRDGVDAITEVPSDRWNISDFYDPNPEAPGKMYSRWGGFLDSIDLFDAAYFGISPREAAVLDPQQRMLLEVSVEALENAGQAPDPHNTSDTGVFVGIMNNNDFVSVKGTSLDPSRVNAHDSTGQATSAAAGRLSYALGFQGPSMAIDTACSSSLVAIHLACQSLRANECQMAIAGGVNVILAPEISVSFCKTRMLSTTGRCRTFDARADGYVRGEGCGMIVLKRLADAVRDQDNIQAIIRGSAVNQDGRSSSLTAPNGLAQEAVVRRALNIAGIRPANVDYIEAHGTGTALGDPIELEALGKVLGEGRDAQQPFLVGSVKTNIGHLESAAGVAGLLKIILSLQNEEIPPHLHLEEVNPHISLADSKASIPTHLTPWPRNGKPRVAGISSFGFVGTNAHLVVEEAPAAATRKQTSVRPMHRLLALSARSPEGLRKVVAQYRSLPSRRSVDLEDLCYTANTGRAHHQVRAAIHAASTDELGEKLAKWAEAREDQARSESSPGEIAFLFTGQGAQYRFMGRRLFEVEPVFRSALERCAEIIDPLLERSLIAVIHGEDAEVLNQTEFAQPALFALEYALAEQWRAWGIKPAMVMGHSLGEYTAAVVAQILSLEQAAKMVVTRGRLMQSVHTDGGSAAVFASEDFVRPYVELHQGAVAIAADNAPERVLIAGEQKPLQLICDALKAKGVQVRAMMGLAAPHSPLMDPILGTFEAIAGMATYNAPAIPMVSTGTARLITQAELSSPRHWRDLIRNKVRFREGMQVLYKAGCRTFLEIGPRHTLVRLGEMCLPFPDVTWLASLSREKHDQQQMLESLGQLYTRGAEVNWVEHHRPFGGRKIALPTTVFERRQFWPEAAGTSSTPGQFVSPIQEGNGVAQLLGRRLRSSLEPAQFEARVDLASLPMLEDHRILGKLLMPGAAHIVRILAATEQLTGRRQLELSDALFPEPMILDDPDDTRIAQLILLPREKGYDFKLSSIGQADDDNAQWRVHATGHVLVSSDANEAIEAGAGPTVSEEISNIDPSMEQFSTEDFYAIQAKSGYQLGPTFRWLRRVWLNKDHALALLRTPPELANNAWLSLHPGLIDSCLQVASRLVNITCGVKGENVLVPAAVSGFRLFGDGREKALQGDLYCRISPLSSSEGEMSVRVTVFDDSGNVVFSIAQVHLKYISAHDLGSTAVRSDESLRRIVWSDAGLVRSQSERRGRWLIFGDEGGTGARLAGLLRGQQQEAVVILKEDAFARNGGSLHLNASDDACDQDEFIRLLTQTQADSGSPWRGIVYLWGLNGSDKATKECLTDDETSNSLGLLNLTKAMIQTAGCPPLWVVTRGAQRTQRENRLGAIGQSMLWGMGRVLANEHSALFGGLVDLHPQMNREDAAAQLVDELWAKDGARQVAYRGGKRLIPRLKPLTRTRTRSRFRVKNDASYLITGAFGALGRKVVEWFVAAGARHLVLLSRRAGDDETSRWLQRLREQGVQLLTLQADVAVMSELAEALVRMEASMPPLRGVIHAAGVLEHNTISKLEWPSLSRVLAPKAQGSWNLHTATLNRSLDFWVIFSSVASLLGNPGQAAYGAGNAYADALAHHRHMQGLPALSINWGPWNGEGMSSRHASDLYRRWGLLPIDPSAGVEMLGQLLSMDGGQLWAAPLDLEQLKERSAEFAPLSLMAELVGAQNGHIPSPDGKTVANGVNRLKDLPEDQRRAAVQEHVIDLVRSVTGMEASEPVRVDARLETLGVDSLLTVDLLNALIRVFGVNLPATILINFPTIELLVKHLCEEIAKTEKPDGTLVMDRIILRAADVPDRPVSVSP